MAVEKAKNVPPFVRFCTASVPMVFDDSMSYYECLCALTKFLQTNVIDVINNNADLLEALQGQFIELKGYVDNYFANLDVQEEINNKLDEMAEGGQLAGIIAQFLAAAPVFAYDNIEAMSEATNLSNGCIARVLGNTLASAGDGAYYRVRTKEVGESADGFYKVAIGATLIADRIQNVDANAIAALDEVVNGECKVNFIYRGRDGGCARLIRVADKNILFDFGVYEYRTDLINYLKAKSIEKIDYVIVSHYHSDHVGGNSGEGLIQFINDNYFDFSDCTFILPHKGIDWAELISYDADADVMETAESTIKAALNTAGITYVEPDDGDVLSISDTTAFTFNNIGSSYYSHYYAAGLYNNFCMLVTLTHNEAKVLFTTDCEELAQKWNANNVDYADVVTAPHHDLNNYCDVDFMKKLNSKYEIIETLFDELDNPLLNTTGISTQFSSYLRTIGCRVYNANTSGEIEVSIKNNNIVVNSAYGAMTDKTNLKTISGGVEIAAGADLNAIKGVGSYFTRSSAITASMSNLPVGYSDPGPIRVTNEQINPQSGQILQTMQTPRTVLQRQLRDATDWSNWVELFNYGLGIPVNTIPNNSDANTYLAAGKYFVNGGTNYTTISHFPEEGGGSNAILLVMNGRREYDTIRQVLLTAANIYYRTGSSSGQYSSTVDNTTWTKWKKVDTTEVEYQ